MSDRDILLLLLSTLITAGLLLWAAIYMIDHYFIAAGPGLDGTVVVSWLVPPSSLTEGRLQMTRPLTPAPAAWRCPR